MPNLDEITYSREITIAAFRDYYEFLIDMFLPDNWIIEPPAGGWPSITKEKADLLGKNDEVYELMRHLPYLPNSSLLLARAPAANWSSVFERRSFDQEGVIGTRIITEGLEWPNIPSSAFGLTRGGRDTFMFILDTQFGTVHWLEGPDIDFDSTRQPIIGPSGDKEPFRDCTPENERGWRSQTAWTITDFFEVLKNEFRTLRSVPVDASQVEYWFGDEDYEELEELDEEDVLIRSIRDTYQEHGWPDVSIYKKYECQDAVDKLMVDCFPHKYS
ncbi:hypothetical protein KCU93_g7469, partial [Aureobasidium melanogenum]